jgi:AcrR family transcriptional regulator
MLTSTTRIRRPAKSSRKPAIQPRKTPVQRRSAETVAVILEAAAHILERDGLTRFNTNAVAIRAGVSIGSLYQFFPGKDAILAALIQQYEEKMLMQFQKTFAAIKEIKGLTLERSLQKLVQTMIASHRDRPALYRILEAAEDRLIEDAGQQLTDGKFRELLRRMLSSHNKQLRIKRIGEAADDVLWIARALMNGALARGEVQWPSLERRTLRAVKGYLLG